MIVLAVDAGGTSTRAAVVADDGSCLGYGTSGSGNPVSTGAGTATESAIACLSDALLRSGVAASKVDMCLVAMAGGLSKQDEDRYSSRIRELGVNSPVLFEGDALAAFYSGTWLQQGYALIVGTGAAAIRVSNSQPVITRDGLGWLLGDDGSGFWIGQQVARAALAALEDRAPETKLSGLLLSELESTLTSKWVSQGRSPKLAAAMETIYRSRPIELARFAKLAFQASPDLVADRIIDTAVQSLAITLEAVMRPYRPDPVVLGGGILTSNPGFAQRIIDSLPQPPEEVQLVSGGLAGAALLALRAAGQEPTSEVFAKIASSLQALKEAPVVLTQ